MIFLRFLIFSSQDEKNRKNHISCQFLHGANMKIQKIKNSDNSDNSDNFFNQISKRLICSFRSLRAQTSNIYNIYINIIIKRMSVCVCVYVCVCVSANIYRRVSLALDEMIRRVMAHSKANKIHRVRFSLDFLFFRLRTRKTGKPIFPANFFAEQT